MVGFILLCLVALVLLITGIISVNEYDSSGFWLIIFAIIIALLSVTEKTTKIGEPLLIDHNKISVMYDENVVIIRYDGNTFEYTDVKKYKAIKKGKFKLFVIKEYNILGNLKSRRFELKLIE